MYAAAPRFFPGALTAADDFPKIPAMREKDAEPHFKKFVDGYRVWNPMSRTYVGDASMAPFRGLDGASARVREVYLEMDDAGVGGAKIRQKAAAIRAEGGGLLRVAPTRRAQEQIGLKFNGRRAAPGRRPKGRGAKRNGRPARVAPGGRATFALADMRRSFVASHRVVHSDHSAAAMLVRDEQGREHFFERDAWEGGGPDAGGVVRVGRSVFLTGYGTANPSHWTRTKHVRFQKV